MQSKIRKIGRFYGVVIPTSLLIELDVAVGDRVDLAVEGDKIVVAPSRQTPRVGWAADSKRLAATGEGNLTWPEFANEGDRNLKWDHRSRWNR